MTVTIKNARGKGAGHVVDYVTRLLSAGGCVQAGGPWRTVPAADAALLQCRHELCRQRADARKTKRIGL